MNESMKVIIGADVAQGVAGIEKFNATVAKIKPGANQATLAMSNMGRVVQDLPFGFLGIANNLNPLLESFQRLKVETGSNKAAFSALLGSLTGPAGLGVALSVASSLLIVFGDRLFGAGKKAEDAKEKVKSFFDLQREANKEIGEELTKVQLLKAVIDSEVTSRKEKESALKRLKDINPDYFGDLKIEEGLIGKLTTAYNKYVAGIQQRSEIRVLEKQLDQLNETIINLQNNGNKSFTTGVIQDAINLAKSQGRTADAMRLQAAATKSQAQDEQKVNGFINQRAALLVKVGQLASQIDVGNDADKKVKAVKEEVEKLRHAVIITNAEWKNLIEIATATTSRGLPSGFDPGKIPTVPSVTLPGSDEEIERAKKFEKMQGRLQEAVKMSAGAVEILSGAFTSMFEAIFSGSKNAFQAFAQAIRNIIIKLAAAAITAAIFAAIISAVTKTPFKTNFQNIGGQLGLPKFAEGGIVSKPTLGLFGESGPEAVVPLDKAGGMFGGGPMHITGEFKIRGKDLVATNIKGTKTLNSIT